MKRKKEPIPWYGKVILQILDVSHTTQRGLSKKTGISPPHLNEYIHGKKAITPRVAVALASATGLTPEYLLTR